MKLKILFPLLTLLSILSCSSYTDIDGQYTITAGKFQSDSLKIIKAAEGKYTVSYIDKLSRGNRSIELTGTRIGNDLTIKMGTMPVKFQFSANFKKFYFSYYGHRIEFQRAD